MTPLVLRKIFDFELRHELEYKQHYGDNARTNSNCIDRLKWIRFANNECSFHKTIFVHAKLILTNFLIRPILSSRYILLVFEPAILNHLLSSRTLIIKIKIPIVVNTRRKIVDYFATAFKNVLFENDVRSFIIPDGPTLLSTYAF